MFWHTDDDMLVFCINLKRINMEIMDGRKVPTKRQALSTVMSIFDPLGLIASFIVFGKIILQGVWREGSDWDDAISENSYQRWKIWTKKLMSIEQLRIPRAYFQHLEPERDKIFDLHIFVDASEEAYSALAYVRASYRDDPKIVECTLISSKTKVAPQKPHSIPRLELLAAVLGVRLMLAVIKAHTIKFSSRTLWSDSSTVLNWLRSDSRRYKSFVALRISECLEATEVTEWRYVQSKINVADEATKWYASPGLTTARWFDGPSFLLDNSSLWPKDFSWKQEDCNEVKSSLLIHTSRLVSTVKIVTVNVSYFQSWNKLVRSQAYFERAVKLFKSRKRINVPDFLTIKEIQNAELSLFKRAQWDVYKEEVATLSIDHNSRVDSSSCLQIYSPYIDQSGVMRMRGRIDKAPGLRMVTKRPIILPRNHDVTIKLVAHYHHIFLHQNHESIVNEIRQRFIIPKLRVLYRHIRTNCQRCKVNSAKPIPPEMGELPLDRLAINIKPFTNVGIDYFGPLEVVVGRRIEKRWGVLYTCLSIRAVHLELVNSLSTDSCIRSLIVFMARRGTPRRIYSDNGTNFRGSNNALKAELRKLQPNEVANKFTQIEWRFIPSGAPHFGGAWERLVKVVKDNLYACLPERRTSEEILRACLAEVELIINSRPLTHIPIDAEDAEALTPNHFILGCSSGEKPLCQIDNDYLPSSKSWKISQMFADSFWRRFVREYLPDLARRTKWYTPTKPIQVGDLVFIVDEKNVRGAWPRGRVVDVMKGADEQVRSAIVRTSTGLYTRPAAKLAVIEVRASNGQSATEDRESLDQGRECRATVHHRFESLQGDVGTQELSK